MHGELWTFSVRSAHGAWFWVHLTLLDCLFFVQHLETKGLPILGFNRTPSETTNYQDHTSQDHFCSVIDEFPVWNSEPDQTMMMRWATFPEREKVSRFPLGDLKHWWSLTTQAWVVNGTVAVWVVMNRLSLATYSGFTSKGCSFSWPPILQWKLAEMAVLHHKGHFSRCQLNEAGSWYSVVQACYGIKRKFTATALNMFTRG